MNIKTACAALALAAGVAVAGCSWTDQMMTRKGSGCPECIYLQPGEAMRAPVRDIERYKCIGNPLLAERIGRYVWVRCLP